MLDESSLSAILQESDYFRQKLNNLIKHDRDSFSVSEASRITGINTSTIYKEIYEGLIECEGESVARKGKPCGRKYSLSLENLIELLLKKEPVDEDWPTAKELAEKYGIKSRTLRKLVSDGKIKGRLACDHQVHIHPTEEFRLREIAKRKAEQDNVSFVEEDGERYISLPSAVSRIVDSLRKKGVHADYRKYYMRMFAFLHRGGGGEKACVKKNGNLYIKETLANWIEQHPTIEEISEMTGRNIQYVLEIVKKGKLPYYNKKQSLNLKRINLSSFRYWLIKNRHKRFQRQLARELV